MPQQMPRRFPTLLARTIAMDLLRLIGLTALVLVTALGFAGAVKPMSDGLLQPQDLLKFMAYATPPMLAYAMPFAAGFGATLVYHRIAHDNEAIAAHAGGISHRTLLAPAAGVGLALAVLLGALNEMVIPAFLNRLERLITRDLANFVVQEIGRGKAVDIGGMTVFADSAQKLVPEPGSGATDLLVLRKLAAIERSRVGIPTTQVTSELAWVWLFPWEGADAGASGTLSKAQSRVVMRLDNIMGVMEGKAIADSKDHAYVSCNVPNPFRDNPKFLSWKDLSELPANPEKMGWVDIRRKELAYCLAERRAVTEMRAKAQVEGNIQLADENARVISIATSGLEQVGETWRLRPGPQGTVTVRMTRPGGEGEPDRVSTLKAPSAVLTPGIGTERFNRGFDFKLDMENVSVTEPTSAGLTTTKRPNYRFAKLRPADNPLPELLALSAPRLLELARSEPVYSNPDAKTVFATSDLSTRVTNVVRQVLSKQHERVAMSISCLVMVLTGAVTSLRLSRRLPLTVYMFTFLPAVICVVTISGGQQATLQVGAAGLLLMWSGVLGLMAYTVVNYRLLVRH